MILAFCRLVIAFQVMAVGVSTPGGYVLKNWRSIGMFLGPITLAMYIISSICVWVAMSVPILEAMIIGACITPTDPVLANSVIKGKFANRYIPTHLRNLLAIESGANDGLGLPFLMLPLLILKAYATASSSAEKGSASIISILPGALLEWTAHTWVYEIAFSVVLGAACGVGARALLRQSEKRHLIDKDSFLVFTLALTLLVTGIAALIRTDDLLAVFICGNAFAWDAKFLLATHDSDINEVIDMLFNITYFVFFGSMIPWDRFPSLGLLKLFTMSLLVLLFRRLPVVMLLRPWLPVLQSRKQAFFAGWFGPMGVGAVFFSLMAREYLLTGPGTSIPGAKEMGEKVFPMVCWMVLSSIVIHGITVPITNFHMKKRAKLKDKRIQRLREQLIAVAGETVRDKDVVKEAAAIDLVDQDQIMASIEDEITEEWEYYTDYEDVEEHEIEGLPETEYIRTPIPEQITIIVDGVESVQETIRPGVKRKVRKRRQVHSPAQSTATSVSELNPMDEISDAQDTVTSAEIPFHLRS